MGLFDKVFGSHSDKELKRISKTVDKIEALDESMQKLSDEELRHKTVEFKAVSYTHLTLPTTPYV